MLFKTNERKNRKITQAERTTEQEETDGNMEGKRCIDKWKRDRSSERIRVCVKTRTLSLRECRNDE